MEAAFDPAVIEQLQELMGDDFQLLLETFINDSNKRLQQIKLAIDEADAELLRNTAHGLKGSALNLSAGPLSELASKFEAMGKAQELSQAAEVFVLLDAELERVCDALRVI